MYGGLIAPLGAVVLQMNISNTAYRYTEVNAHPANEGEHVACYVALCEAGAGVGEQVLPLALEDGVLLG